MTDATDERQSIIREALLVRFATNLTILVSYEPLQRPVSMRCCWVDYRLNGESWTHAFCGQDWKFCAHHHHRFEVFLA